ncbi:MAG TPA: DUF6701 domain-containing protein [Sideroxyarcus sp.]|nr:DUF6701 domain-containing protein [Sideroxyarcus sp.]
MKHIGLAVWALAALLLAENAAAVVCTSKANGNWGTAATWDCGKVPATADTVVLASPFTVTLNNNYTTAGLTINAGATLSDTNGNTLTVTGNITNNGTFTSNNDGIIASTGAAAVISGIGTFANTARLYTSGTAPSIAAGANLNFTGTAQFRVGRDPAGNTVAASALTINGTLTGTGQTGGTGTPFIRLYATNTVVGSAGVINAPAATIQYRSNGTLTNNGSVNIGTINLNGGTGTWTNAANSSLTVNTSFAASALNASATGNTVTYIAPATAVVPSGNTYYNLTGSGVTCPHTFTVLGSNPCTTPPGSGFAVSSPTSCSSMTGVGTIAWTIPANAVATDNVYATAITTAAATTNYLNCTGFNFAGVPVGATITGITVSIERKGSRTRRSSDAFVYLIKGGVINTLFNGKTATQYTAADVIEAHGGMTNLWGTSWTDADVKAPGFGVAYAAVTTRALTVSVDHIQVRVDYTSPLTVTPSGFNAYDTTTTPAGSISGFIGTKVAGQSFMLDLAALDTAGTGLLTTFTGAVKVELVDATDNRGTLAGSCRSTWTRIQTLANETFAASDQTTTGSKGRHRTAAITVNNAYKNVRVRVAYPADTPTQVGCSTDSFAIRPASFGAVSARDLDAQTAFNGTGTARTLNNTAASGGVVHKAGQPFTLSATAYNADGSTASSNYSGSPIAVVNTTLPVGGVDGALAIGGWTVSAGVITSTTATYDEAGVIDMTLEDRDFAVVDNGDGTALSCAGLYICSATSAVGRFVPDHFELMDASADPALDALVDTALDTWLPTTAHQFRTFGVTDAACNAAAAAPKRSFTYLGQSFGYVTPPQATIKAMDALGGWIQNYDFAKLTTGGVSQTYTAASGALDVSLALQTPVLTENANYASGSSIIGTVTLNAADKLAFVRGATPVAGFDADITLLLGVTDSSENAVAGNGDISGTFDFLSIQFDAKSAGVSGAQMRYGRLKLANAVGSEQLALPVPMFAQYYDGTNWQNNVDDHCTAIALAAVTLTKSPTGLATAATLNNPLLGGNGGLRLSKPGATGTVDITVAAPSYLPSNAARATFGVYKGAKEFIYLRER